MSGGLTKFDRTTRHIAHALTVAQSNLNLFSEPKSTTSGKELQILITRSLKNLERIVNE